MCYCRVSGSVSITAKGTSVFIYATPEEVNTHIGITACTLEPAIIRSCLFSTLSSCLQYKLQFQQTRVLHLSAHRRHSTNKVWQWSQWDHIFTSAPHHTYWCMTWLMGQAFAHINTPCWVHTQKQTTHITFLSHYGVLLWAHHELLMLLWVH